MEVFTNNIVKAYTMNITTLKLTLIAAVLLFSTRQSKGVASTYYTK